MEILKNLLKFIFIAILTMCMISIGMISIVFSTVFNKDYIMQKLEETNFYSGIYELVKSNFENYIYQSGLDEEVLDDICTEEKIKQDIQIMLSNIYNGTNQKIDTTEIADKLNSNIEKLGVKNRQNENAIQQFVTHICDEYTNTLIHTKYENKINEIYKRGTEILNKIYKIILVVFVIDIIVIIIINNKKISKDIQHIGIALLATSIFELSVWKIINLKVDIHGIKIFNDVFSKSVVVIIENTLGQVASLALGTIVIGVIFITIYAARETYKSLKQKEVSSERKI